MSLGRGESRKASRFTGYLVAIAIVGVVIASAFAGAFFAEDQEVHPETTSVEDMHRRANRLFLEAYSMHDAREVWQQTADAYQEIVDIKPDDGEAWFRLGFALHFARQLDQAIEANKVASTFKRSRPLALYNIACSYALKGDTENSLKYLEQAVDSGFRARQPIENDTDLVSLLDNERFRELAMATRPASQLPERKRMDFWLGSWVVYMVTEEENKRVGIDTVTKEENGFLLAEKWVGDEGSSGQSSNWYDAATDQWIHQWFDSSGSVTTYRGGWVDEENKMMFQGEHVAADGATMRMRMAFAPRPDGTIHQLIESTQDGEEWTTCFEAIYQPNGGQQRRPTTDEVGCYAPESRNSLATPRMRGSLQQSS